MVNEFQQQAVNVARGLTAKTNSKPTAGNIKLSDPVVIAGLADIVKNATAAMARAKAAGQNLTSSVGDLMAHVAAVESIHDQVTSANRELESAIATVGAPLDNTQHSVTNSGAVSVTGPSPNVPGTDGATQPTDLSQTSASPQHLNAGMTYSNPEHGVASATVQVQAENTPH